MTHSFTRRALIKVAAAAAVLGAAPSGGIARRAPIRRMRPDVAGRLYGSAVRADLLIGDPVLRQAVMRDCDWITPEIDFKWNALEHERESWWFERADALAAFCRASGKQLRGHTLLWDQSTPKWAKADLAERQDWALVGRWFATVLGRYGASACEWDVVNEPIDTVDGNGGLRRNCFHRAFGEAYVGRALALAHEHAPQARLLINEYSLEYANPVERDRRRALVLLSERLRHQGVPLHGIGLQAHLDLAKGPLDARAISAMLHEFEQLGLSVTITELDVREADRALPIGVRDARIADEVRRYLDVVLASPAVRGVVTWGVSDRDSWLQEANATKGKLNRGLPLDERFDRKPMYWSLREAMAVPPRIA